MFISELEFDLTELDWWIEVDESMAPVLMFDAISTPGWKSRLYNGFIASWLTPGKNKPDPTDSETVDSRSGISLDSASNKKQNSENVTS